MYWLAAGSNRPQISDPMMAMVDSQGIRGGIWMLHNYWKSEPLLPQHRSSVLTRQSPFRQDTQASVDLTKQNSDSLR